VRIQILQIQAAGMHRKARKRGSLFSAACAGQNHSKVIFITQE